MFVTLNKQLSFGACLDIFGNIAIASKEVFDGSLSLGICLFQRFWQSYSK